MSEADKPKTWDDLLLPEWKGKMAVTSEPIQIGLPGMTGYLIRAWGEKKAVDYLQALANQDVALIPASPRVVLDQVSQGQYSIALQTLAYHSVLSAEQGAPLKWLKLNPMQVTVHAVGYFQGAGTRTPRS
ncbi:hypothetical protein E4O86_05470 [Rhizobiales bacterium L72]|uniref:Uncharacterized protein n=1 Tax=Propylenella binzhouense TaxID=2555902 RepID=A0A964T3C1_9HYPH|nr:hypothetical protein [Propylenella binzhouense]